MRVRVNKVLHLLEEVRKRNRCSKVCSANRRKFDSDLGIKINRIMSIDII